MLKWSLQARIEKQCVHSTAAAVQCTTQYLDAGLSLSSLGEAELKLGGGSFGAFCAKHRIMHSGSGCRGVMVQTETKKFVKITNDRRL